MRLIRSRRLLSTIAALAALVSGVLVVSAGGAASASAHATNARSAPVCGKYFAADSCSITGVTPTSLTMSYTIHFIYPECTSGSGGCVYSLFMQLDASGWGTFTASVSNNCPGRAVYKGTGDAFGYYDYPLPTGTSMTCTMEWTWPKGQTLQGIAVNATELDGQAITLANSDHSFGVNLPAPPPIASFSFKEMQASDGTYLFTDTSTTFSTQGLVESWSSSDGATGTGATWTHQFDSSGTYTVDLTVTDVNHLSDSVSHDVDVTLTPSPGVSATITVREVVAPSPDPGRFNLFVNGAQVAHAARSGIQTVANVRPGHYAVAQLASTVALTHYGIEEVCMKSGKLLVRASASSVIVAVTPNARVICTFTDTRTTSLHCDVPLLKGKALAAATSALRASDCVAGAIVRSGSPGPGKSLKVAASSPGPYAVLPGGSKVALHLVYST